MICGLQLLMKMCARLFKISTIELDSQKGRGVHNLSVQCDKLTKNKNNPKKKKNCCHKKIYFILATKQYNCLFFHRPVLEEDVQLVHRAVLGQRRVFQRGFKHLM